MAYFKTKSQGEVRTITGTTGAGTAPSMPNSGVSVLSETTAESIVLQPPIAGCEKTIVLNTYSTTAFPIIKFSSNAAQTISLLGVSTNLTHLKAVAGRSTVCPTIITLKGVNSTSWLLMNVFPAMGAVTTGSSAVSNAVSVSST
jgi:hypothetical protein